jgi:hypothetical protein
MRVQAELTLLASAARTADPTVTAETDNQHPGVLLILDVSAASGTGGLTVSVRGYDPISDNTFDLLVDQNAILATGTYAFLLALGAARGANGLRVSEGFVLPRKWDVTVVHGDGSSYTYSLSATMLAS